MQSPKVSDILGIINKFAPLRRAESWDNPGLQVGDLQGAAARIMVSLDPCGEAVHAAADVGCGLLVTHHPLIFSPLKRLSAQDAVGGAVMEAVRRNVSVVAAHTNYDAADGGLNDLLARRLGLRECEPLRNTGSEKLAKLVIFAPAGYEDAVREAVFPFAVTLGRYDECSFMASGTGTFRPLEGARPFSGEEGRRTLAQEGRLEFLVREEDAAAAMKAMGRVHPYEEPAVDVYPLLNRGSTEGVGRCGLLPQPLQLGDFARQVKESLAAPGLRVVGSLDRQVRKVALCGGSGAFLLNDASFRGADVLVTGDIKYHEARNAEALGVALIDAGHFSTEKVAIDGLADIIRRGLEGRGMTADVLAYAGEREPFIFL
jgi:dinuclear metal center YbgI/SA1388 family protein